MESKPPVDGFEQIYQQMEHYHKLALGTPCPLQRLRYEAQLLQEIRQFMQLVRQTIPGKQFTLAELAQNNGAGGKPAYVAVNGVVYDVSTEPTWGGGTHFGQYAGQDLTVQFAGCHGMQAILAKLPRVGVLVSG